MKAKFLTLATVAALSCLTLGCESLLTTHAGASSVPVEVGASNTNDVQAVAYLKLAQQLNTSLNPTPTEPLVNQGIGALIALVSALAGFFGHRSASSSGAAIASAVAKNNVNPPAKT